MSRLLVLVSGYNASGKSTLSRKLSEDLGCNRINGDDFLEFIRQSTPYFSDLDISHVNTKYDMLKQFKVDYRNQLATVLLQADQAVILDVSAHKKITRQQLMGPLKSIAGAKTAIIWIDISEDELLRRLNAREQSEKWVEQYHQKGAYERPGEDEADYVLRYDQNNYDEIKSRVAELLG